MLAISREISDLIDKALYEDRAYEDATTSALISPDLHGEATITSKDTGILAGITIAQAVFNHIDPTLWIQVLLADGTRIKHGEPTLKIRGALTSILAAERTALNFLQHMSGIATETDRYVRAIEGLASKVVDTRKTIPGFRQLDKYAVRTGGGHNHRLDLASGILIKDNHIAALVAQGMSIADVLSKAREKAPHTLKIEVEVETVAQARNALEANADLLLLDNMTIVEMRQVVMMAQGNAIIEASGGITLESIREVAKTGVTLISIGALTHSAHSLDMSLAMNTIPHPPPSKQ
jgi:nicotinate-nucleotide pyrophosphorylase (carboxylating)